MKRKINLLSAFLLLTIFSFAQELKKVTGIVVGEDNNPIPHVTISVSTGKQTQTSESGKFEVELKRGDIVNAQSLGYHPESMVYRDEATIRFVLRAQEKNLDEVVVIGYGTSKRRDLVGAVDQISGDKLQNRGNMNISRALQGQMPGLNISMRDGKPSRGATLNVRGTGSIGAGGSALSLSMVWRGI
ncbi:carboxypeptidase-like regulatory domain-containing protein [Sphingobacterium sp. T2]|uniref:carboxypeptidase-like regulatory domain-containing protein n=1 Tax=Sphingobacterium sp. T2 TaxID=1590596 RepID=UPI0018CFE8D7|nr:carboxypeptidase-like regulatory domain-containing protein [Sphingobacterium sp. T2]